jgi:hypothetical protein
MHQLNINITKSIIAEGACQPWVMHKLACAVAATAAAATTLELGATLWLHAVQASLECCSEALLARL